MAPAGRTRRPGRTAARLLPALAGCLTVLGLAVATLRVGSSNLAQAEATRLEARRNLVTGLANHADTAIADGRVEDTVRGLLLQPDAPELDAYLLSRFADQHGGYPVSRVLVLRADSSEIASAPTGAPVPAGAFGEQWAQALRGSTVRTSLLQLDGEPVTATLVPIGGPRPWGVVVALQPALTSPLPDYYAGIGGLGDRPGGLTLVDRNGVAVASWDRDRIGTAVLDPPARQRLGDEPVVWTTGTGDGEVTWVGAKVRGGYALVFQQATDDLFDDLRSAQRQRDTTLLALLGLALVVLIVLLLRREQAARRAESRIRALLEHSHDLVLVCDSDGRLTFVSPAIRRLLGVDPRDWTGRPLTSVCHPDEAAAAADLLASPAGRAPLDLRLEAADGEHRWFDVEATDVHDVGSLDGILLTCRELGERKALQDALTHQATHDSLTGAVNRAELSARIEGLLTDGRPRQALALLYLDLDGFKAVNDDLGHEAGDQVLRSVVRRLVQALGPGATVGRFGGDELGVLLPGADLAATRAACERALGAVGQPIPIGGGTARVGASIGVALVGPGDAVSSPDELIRRADLAMYGAKRAGGGRVRLARSASPGPAPRRAAASPAHPPPPAPDPEPTTATSTTTTRPSSANAPRRSRSTVLIALGVAVAVATTIVATAYAQSQASQRAAEARRVTELEEVAVHSAAYYATQTRFDRFATITELMPFTLDPAGPDAFILDGWTEASELGDGATALLADLEGRTLASASGRAGLGPRADHPAWAEARRGQVAFAPYVPDADQPRSYVLVPVRRGGSVAAVLLLGSSSIKGQVPRLLATGASPSAGGGWLLLDPEGRAFAAPTPELVGTELAAPAELADLAAGESQARIDEDGDVLVVTPMPGFLAGRGYLAYWAPGGVLFADLQAWSAARGIGLGLLVASAVVGLALINSRREQAARRSERHLEALLQNSHDIIVVLGPDGAVRFVSSGLERVLGVPIGQLTGRDLIDLVHPADRAAVAKLLDRPDAGPVRDVRVLDAGGGRHWFDLDASDLRGHPAVRGILLTGHDITERRALQDQIAYRAQRDPLTGLPNRASFEAHLDELGRRPPEPYAVLFIDLDRFKPVNDRFGHDVGDEVLRVMAGRLTSAVRQGDLVYRVGGDEFAVVLADVTEERARSTAARIVQLAGDPVSVRGASIAIGATVGIALAEAGSAHPQRAVRHADLAMYQAKQAGRGTFALFSPDM